MISSVRRRITGYLYRMIFFGTFIASFTLQAGQTAEIQKYTLQRGKLSDSALPALQASKLPTVEVTEQEGIYHIKAVAVIDASATHVRHVLTDYIHIYRLNPSIIESGVIEQHDDGSVSVRTRVIGCAAYFCEELDRVEKVRELSSGDLHAEIIPELSDFKSGQTLWRIKSLGEYSEVTYLSDMEPDVFIPPIVGKFLLKKSIRKEMQISFANLEKISSILAEREWQEDYQPVYNTFEGMTTPCINTIANLSGIGK